MKVQKKALNQYFEPQNRLRGNYEVFNQEGKDLRFAKTIKKTLLHRFSSVFDTRWNNTRLYHVAWWQQHLSHHIPPDHEIKADNMSHMNMKKFKHSNPWQCISKSISSVKKRDGEEDKCNALQWSLWCHIAKLRQSQTRGHACHTFRLVQSDRQVIKFFLNSMNMWNYLLSRSISHESLMNQ